MLIDRQILQGGRSEFGEPQIVYIRILLPFSCNSFPLFETATHDYNTGNAGTIRKVKIRY